MAEGGGTAPPPEARRGGTGRGIVTVVVVVVAVLAFVGGLALGPLVFPPAPQVATLVVGTNIPFPPFEDYNTTTSTFFGFDIDIARMIAHATHRTLVVKNYADFDALLATVGKNGVDMAASAITSTGATGANRSTFLTFSITYYDANQGVLIQSSNPMGVSCPSGNCTNPSILDKPNYVLGVQRGTTSESWTTANIKNATVRNFTAVDTELAALRAGSLTAVIIDNGPAGAFASGSNGALVVAGTINTGEQYSFAVAHLDPQNLIPVINGVIFTAQQNGTYQRLITKWFG
jgi:ABC-type amino acid transport substrate-binding protein